MIRVIGLGSPFGDDQAGWWVVAHLRDQPCAAIELLALDRPGAALVNWMEGVSHLVVVDAVVCELPPGHILHIDPDRLDPVDGLCSTHQVTIGESLRLAEVLGCRPARVDLFGIAVHDASRATASIRLAARRLAGRLRVLLCAGETPATDRGVG